MNEESKNASVEKVVAALVGEMEELETEDRLALVSALLRRVDKIRADLLVATLDEEEEEG